MRVSRLPDVLYIPVRLDAMLVVFVLIFEVFVLIFEVFVSIFAPLGCVKIPANPETVTMSAAFVVPVDVMFVAFVAMLAALVVPVEVMFEVFVSIFSPLGCVKVPANPETVMISE